MKYSAEGSTVRIAGSVDGEMAVVSVSDQGVGVAAEELPQVSGLYFRGGNSQGIPGAGIGLYLVERFVAMHGGTMSVESEVGKGTTVTIRLPSAAPGREDGNG